MTPTTKELALEKAAINLFWDEGEDSAIYIVWRFGSEKHAADFLEGSVASYVQQEGSESLYTSRVADEYHRSCGWSSRSRSYRCTLRTRYEEFVFYFQLETFNNDPISLKQFAERFEQIIIFIDEQIIDYLDKQ